MRSISSVIFSITLGLCMQYHYMYHYMVGHQPSWGGSLSPALLTRIWGGWQTVPDSNIWTPRLPVSWWIEGGCIWKGGRNKHLWAGSHVSSTPFLLPRTPPGAKMFGNHWTIERFPGPNNRKYYWKSRVWDAFHVMDLSSGNIFLATKQLM